MAERLVFNKDAANHIQAYIDYHNIVGDYDGGKLLSEQQYQQFKEQAQNSKNRVYLTWRNSKGLDCKIIGPASMCFCGHRFKEHEYINPKNKKVVCRKPKCTCPCFNHVPVFGSNDFKCLCKHSYTEHDPITKKCTRGMCGCNVRFASTYTCSCGSKFGEHQTIIETKEERIAQGKSVDEMMMAEGLPTFNALAEGADRYEHMIDQMGQQKALGPSQQYKQLQYNNQPQQQVQQQMDPKKAKLQNLNQKIQQEKKGNQFQRNDYDEDEYNQNQQFQISESNERSLFQLFQTPHIYANANLPTKKQLKYK